MVNVPILALRDNAFPVSSNLDDTIKVGGLEYELVACVLSNGSTKGHYIYINILLTINIVLLVVHVLASSRTSDSHLRSRARQDNTRGSGRGSGCAGANAVNVGKRGGVGPGRWSG